MSSTFPAVKTSLVVIATEYESSKIILFCQPTLAHSPNCRSPRQNRQEKTTPPFWRNLSSNSPCFLSFLHPSQHQYHISFFLPSRINLATPSTASHLASLSQRSVLVDMASEKTPEVGDKGTWSFLQRVAREQPFSFCGFYTSICASLASTVYLNIVVCSHVYPTRLTFLLHRQPPGTGTAPPHPEKSPKRKPKAKSPFNPNAATPSRNPHNPMTLRFTSPAPATTS